MVIFLLIVYLNNLTFAFPVGGQTGRKDNLMIDKIAKPLVKDNGMFKLFVGENNDFYIGSFLCLGDAVKYADWMHYPLWNVIDIDTNFTVASSE